MENFIDESARVGEGTKVGRYSVIEKDVRIGKGCIIGNNVTIHPGTQIGDSVRIDDSTVIGKQLMKSPRSATTKDQKLRRLRSGTTA